MTPFDPELSNAELGVKHLFLQGLRHPIEAFKHRRAYREVMACAWMRRQRARVDGLFFIGLPDEAELLQNASALELGRARKALFSARSGTIKSGRLQIRIDDLAQRANGRGFAHRFKGAENPGPFKPQTLLYVAHASVKDMSNGYTIRTHRLLSALVSQGWSVHVMTQPDNKPPYDQYIDGVRYVNAGIATTQWTSWAEYIEMFADMIGQEIENVGAGLVQAASNHILGEAGLIAAKRAGRPFIYEARGLWHVTREAGSPSYPKTTAWKAQENTERYILSQADHVFALNPALQKRLLKMGARQDRVSLLPNAGTPSGQNGTRSTGNRDQLRLGYVGSLVHYEGIDVMLDALGALPDATRVKMSFHVIGDGSHASELRDKAAQMALSDIVRFDGRFNSDKDDLRALYSEFDMVVLPRRSNAITELVCPIKPYEAIAFGCPLIVSDVAPLKAFAIRTGAAVTFRADDPIDLAARLTDLLELVSKGDERLQELGSSGSDYIRDNASWAMRASHMSETLDRLSRRGE